MITITLEKIKQHNPCPEGWATLLEAHGGSKTDLTKDIPVSSILDWNNLYDTLWVLQFLPEHELLWRKFAWWCAKRVVRNPTDKRVSGCLDVVERYCDGLATDDELRAAKLDVESAAESTARPAELAGAWSAEAELSEELSLAGTLAVVGALSAVRAAAMSAARALSAARAAAMSAELSVAGAEALAEAESAEREAQEIKLRRILELGYWED